MANYQVENQWGGSAAPWHPGGQWRLGSRTDQHIVQINIFSQDNGTTLEGIMTYNGEGPISVKATYVSNNTYTVENQWGGSSAPWHQAGEWIIGNRDSQKVLLLSAMTSDSNNLIGVTTYQGEGPIGFKAALEI